LKKYITQNSIPRTAPIKQYEIDFHKFYEDTKQPNFLCPICSEDVYSCGHAVAEQKEAFSELYMIDEKIDSINSIQSLFDIDLDILKNIDVEFYKKVREVVEDNKNYNLFYALNTEDKLYFYEKILQYYFKEEIVKIRITELERSPLVFYFRNVEGFFDNMSNKELFDIFQKNSKVKIDGLRTKDYDISINELYDFSESPVVCCPVCEDLLDECTHVFLIDYEGEKVCPNGGEEFHDFCNNLSFLNDIELKKHLKGNETYYEYVKTVLNRFNEEKEDYDDLYDFLYYEGGDSDFFEIYIFVNVEKPILISVYESGFGCSGGPVSCGVDYYLNDPNCEFHKMRYEEFHQKVNQLSKGD